MWAFMYECEEDEDAFVGCPWAEWAGALGLATC
jgi:hypothetical protein